MEKTGSAADQKKKKSGSGSSALTTILLIFILLMGIGIIAYPTVSDWWNSRHQSRAIASYAEKVAEMDEETYAQVWDRAREYNQSLLKRDNHFLLSEEQIAEYEELLNLDGSGMMGSIEIPKIKVSYPVYHGVSESVLQVAIGHIEWSSLPAGGKGSHCLLSGHRGLPSARLFTDLDQMEIGDIFMLKILNETLTYQVDQIRIVLPQDMSDLLIQPGKDLCTLITCTPYGVNTHRMLVRGHRIDNIEEEAEDPVIYVSADATQIPGYLVAPAVGIPMLFIFHLFMLIYYSRQKRPYTEEELDRQGREFRQDSSGSGRKDGNEPTSDEPKQTKD